MNYSESTHHAASPHSVILAIDVGSSSVRCTAYKVTHNGETPHTACVVASSSQLRRSIHPSTSRILLEQGENESSLLDVIDTLVDTVLEQLRSSGDPIPVCAVGFSTFVMNLVGVDQHGQLIGDSASMSYACSQTPEVVAEVEHLKRELGNEGLLSLYQKTGAPLHPAYALAQLRAWYNQPHNDTVVQWQTIASACLCRWTGRTSLPISYSEASWTGLLNIQTCQYETSVLNLLPAKCRDALPALADYDLFAVNHKICPNVSLTDSIAGKGLNAESILCLAQQSPYYERWKELRQVRLFLGVGDGACANLGSRCSIPSRIACTVGTSAAARICLPLSLRENGADASACELVQPGLFCYRIDRSHVLVGGALTDGGSVVEWLASLLNRPVSSDSFAECLQQAEEHLENGYAATNASSSARPLTVVPFFSGERSTGFNGQATGAMAGLTLETTPAHLLHGCLEGITLRLNAIVQRIVAASAATTPGSAPPLRILCSGRALEVNALWRRMLADCTGLDVILDEDTSEATSRGVVALIAAALSQSDSRTSLTVEYGVVGPVTETRTCRPASDARLYWDEATSRQEAFINAVSLLNYR